MKHPIISKTAGKEAGLPAVITFSPATEQTCDGHSWAEACKILSDNGADVVGLNCGRGPATMFPILEDIRRKVSTRILSRKEAFAIPDLIRTKINLLPEAIKKVRVVEIAGLDLQADGGTHVNNTNEVGSLAVAAYKSKGAINKRIYLEVKD